METTIEGDEPDDRTISEMGATSFLIPTRQDQSELLDQEMGSMADVRINLIEMWRLNRYFGGIEALTCHLYPLLQQGSQPLSVVDIGTGSGEMGALLTRWAKQNDRQLLICAFDKSERNLSVAREKTIENMNLMQADACALPFAEGQVDYFISSLFLHHLSPEEVIGVLRETYHRSRRGIVMSDLVRSYIPLLAFRLIQPVFAQHYLTRHDGSLSIRRAYTSHELISLARAAGLETAHIYRHFPWRMTLVAEKPGV